MGLGKQKAESMLCRITDIALGFYAYTWGASVATKSSAVYRLCGSCACSFSKENIVINNESPKTMNILSEFVKVNFILLAPLVAYEISVANENEIKMKYK